MQLFNIEPLTNNADVELTHNPWEFFCVTHDVMITGNEFRSRLYTTNVRQDGATSTNKSWLPPFNAASAAQ
jgi:hypothetical protein